MGQCPSLEQIGALLENRVPEDEKKELLAHLSKCPNCSKLYTTGVLHMGLQEEGLVPDISETMQQRMAQKITQMIHKQYIYMHLYWSKEPISLFNTHRHIYVAENVQTAHALFDTQSVDQFNYPHCYFLIHQNGFNIYAASPEPNRIEINGKNSVLLDFNSGMCQVENEMLELKTNQSLSLLRAYGENDSEIQLIFEIK